QPRLDYQAGSNTIKIGVGDYNGDDFPDLAAANYGSDNVSLLLNAADWFPAPSVSCSVAHSVLWPPNHKLVNVGFGVVIDPPSAPLHVLVYGNDQADPSDAADIAPETLQLRAERRGNGNGRVYLIVVTATDASGQTGFDVCTAVVPHDQRPESIALVQAEAAAAEAFYREFQAAPPGYSLLGEGPEAGDGTGPPNAAGWDGGFPITGMKAHDTPAILRSLSVSTDLLMFPEPKAPPKSLTVQEAQSGATSIPMRVSTARQVADAVFEGWISAALDMLAVNWLG